MNDQKMTSSPLVANGDDDAGWTVSSKTVASYVDLHQSGQIFACQITRSGTKFHHECPPRDVPNRYSPSLSWEPITPPRSCAPAENSAMTNETISFPISTTTTVIRESSAAHQSPSGEKRDVFAKNIDRSVKKFDGKSLNSAAQCCLTEEEGREESSSGAYCQIMPANRANIVELTDESRKSNDEISLGSDFNELLPEKEGRIKNRSIDNVDKIFDNKPIDFSVISPFKPALRSSKTPPKISKILTRAAKNLNKSFAIDYIDVCRGGDQSSRDSGFESNGSCSNGSSDSAAAGSLFRTDDEKFVISLPFIDPNNNTNNQLISSKSNSGLIDPDHHRKRSVCPWYGCGMLFPFNNEEDTTYELCRHVVQIHVTQTDFRVVSELANVPSVCELGPVESEHGATTSNNDDGPSVSSSASSDRPNCNVKQVGLLRAAPEHGRFEAVNTEDCAKLVRRPACLWRGCRSFGAACPSFEWLERHVLERHGGKRPFPCIVDACRERFASRVALHRHMNAHFDQNSPKTAVVDDDRSKPYLSDNCVNSEASTKQSVENSERHDQGVTMTKNGQNSAAKKCQYYDSFLDSQAILDELHWRALLAMQSQAADLAAAQKSQKYKKCSGKLRKNSKTVAADSKNQKAQADDQEFTTFHCIVLAKSQQQVQINCNASPRRGSKNKNSSKGSSVPAAEMEYFCDFSPEGILPPMWIPEKHFKPSFRVPHHLLPYLSS